MQAFMKKEEGNSINPINLLVLFSCFSLAAHRDMHSAPV